MMDDQTAQATPAQTDEQEGATPGASPAPAPESVEQEKKDGDEQATA